MLGRKKSSKKTKVYGTKGSTDNRDSKLINMLYFIFKQKKVKNLLLSAWKIPLSDYLKKES